MPREPIPAAHAAWMSATSHPAKLQRTCSSVWQERRTVSSSRSLGGSSGSRALSTCATWAPGMPDSTALTMPLTAVGVISTPVRVIAHFFSTSCGVCAVPAPAVKVQLPKTPLLGMPYPIMIIFPQGGAHVPGISTVKEGILVPTSGNKKRPVSSCKS